MLLKMLKVLKVLQKCDYLTCMSNDLSTKAKDKQKRTHSILNENLETKANEEKTFSQLPLSLPQFQHNQVISALPLLGSTSTTHLDEEYKEFEKLVKEDLKASEGPLNEQEIQQLLVLSHEQEQITEEWQNRFETIKSLLSRSKKENSLLTTVDRQDEQSDHEGDDTIDFRLTTTSNMYDQTEDSQKNASSDIFLDWRCS
jgi:hypothetical protein